MLIQANAVFIGHHSHGGKHRVGLGPDARRTAADQLVAHRHNQFNDTGQFSFTKASCPVIPQNFYRLQLP